MTREEALTRLRLKSHQAFCEYVENGNQENEEAALDVLAHDMAITALREKAERGGCGMNREEAGRDDTTTVTRDVCYDHGEITNYGAYRCDKCGAKQPDRYPHCPGCGRRIER